MTRASNRSRQAFRLKGMMPALTLLCLMTEDLDAIERQLVDHLSQMPQFFLHAPVVVDLGDLCDARVDLVKLGELLRRHHLVPVAVREPSDTQRQRAIDAGWGVLQSNSVSARRPSSSRAAADESPSAPAPASGAEAKPAQSPALTPSPPPPAPIDHRERPAAGLTVRTPVRSGQVIYAMGGDLVVLAPVSSGAELIADGNIHVYAPLRGRALAGAHDNPEASIFCMSLQAEFLSIAGRYIMAEEMPKDQRGKAVRAHLQGDDVVLSRI